MAKDLKNFKKMDKAVEANISNNYEIQSEQSDEELKKLKALQNNRYIRIKFKKYLDIQHQLSGTKSSESIERPSAEVSEEDDPQGEMLEKYKKIFKYRRQKCINFDLQEKKQAEQHQRDLLRNQALAMWKKLSDKIIGKIPKAQDVGGSLDMNKLKGVEQEILKSLVKDELKAIQQAKEDMSRVPQKKDNGYRYMQPQNRKGVSKIY